jgi:tRNA(Met) C34 N-acetyltransferase TmcA
LLACPQFLTVDGIRVSRLAVCPDFKGKAASMFSDQWAQAKGYI